MSLLHGDEGGQIVRKVWVAWAKEQHDSADHPHWLTEWEQLAPRDQEVDRRIAAAIEAQVLERLILYLAGERFVPQATPAARAIERQTTTPQGVPIIDETDPAFGHLFYPKYVYQSVTGYEHDRYVGHLDGKRYECWDYQLDPAALAAYARQIDIETRQPPTLG